MSFTLGCDPELYLWDNVKQRIVPAVGKIGGTKVKPMKVDGGMLQLDGTLVEFGIDPAETADEFVNNIQRVIDVLRDKLYKRFKGRYDVRCGALVAMSPEDISPNSSALDVGCSPQFRFSAERSLEVLRGVPHLSIDEVPAGGHLHFGFGVNMSTDDERLIVSASRYLNKLEGINLITDTRNDYRRDSVLNLRWDAVRIKPYGVEWRNMSSLWLADKEFAKAIFNYSKCVFDKLSGAANPESLSALLDKAIRRRRLVTSAAMYVNPKYQETLPLDF